MNIYLKFLLIVFLLSACRTNKTVQNNTSDSVKKSLEIIKNKILEEENSVIEIQIINHHGGRYIINSIIESLTDSIIVKTYVVDMSNNKSDTIFSFSLEDFINKLDYEIKYSENQLVFAGTFQTISILNNGKIQYFKTQKGLGLMSLLVRGKSNIQVPQDK